MLGFLLPWYFFVPDSWRQALGQSIIPIAFFAPGVAVGIITWLRLRSHELVLEGETAIWYRVGGNVIWGGPWKTLSASRQGVRRVVTDPAGRKVIWEQITMRFELPQSVKGRAPEVEKQEKIQAKGSGVFVWSLVAFVVGFALSFVCIKEVHATLARDVFVADATFVLALVVVCIGQILLYGGLFGMILGLRGVLPEKAVKALEESSKATRSSSDPVEMKPGVRYVYDDAGKLMKNNPGPAVMWVAFGFLGVFFLVVAIYSWVGHNDRAGGIGCLAAVLGSMVLGWYLAKKLGEFRLGAFDEFERRSTGELVVHRNGESRTFKKLGEAMAANKSGSWGQWYEKYRDHRGEYRLDTRFIVEKSKRS